MQYSLDVQYAVGRIHFDAVDDYSCHVRIAVTAERGGLRLSRGVAFLSVAHADDLMTPVPGRAALPGLAWTPRVEAADPPGLLFLR